jgi:protein TonB
MSDLGSLSQCLVDCDSDAGGRSRRLRREAFLFSVVFEFALIAALILWPLFSPSVLAKQYVLTPLPPYAGGSGPANHPRSGPRPPKAASALTICRSVCAPTIRSHAPVDDSGAPEVGGVDSNSEGVGDGLPWGGQSIPGGIGNTPVVLEPPRPVTPRSQPLRRSGELMAAMIVHRVEPVYPAMLRAAHVSGAVHLHAIIGKDGTIRELTLVDGNIILARSAMSAVQMWRYRPTMLNGKPVEVETYITVNFVLN